MNLIELAIFGGITLCMSGLVLLVIMLAYKSRKLLHRAAQAEMDKFFILAKLDNLIQTSDNKSIEESDGFVKFLSESRESAFEYIEDIQMALRAYDIALGLDDAKVLNEAYKKLISFLPEDEDASIS